jgi:hypothetical protein
MVVYACSQYAGREAVKPEKSNISYEISSDCPGGSCSASSEKAGSCSVCCQSGQQAECASGKKWFTAFVSCACITLEDDIIHRANSTIPNISTSQLVFIDSLIVHLQSNGYLNLANSAQILKQSILSNDSETYYQQFILFGQLSDLLPQAEKDQIIAWVDSYTLNP